MEHIIIQGERFIAEDLAPEDYKAVWDLWNNKEAIAFCLGETYLVPEEKNFRAVFTTSLHHQPRSPRPAYDFVVKLRQDRGLLGIASIGNIAQKRKGISGALHLLADPFFVSVHYPFQDALESIVSFAYQDLGITTLTTKIPSYGRSKELSPLLQKLEFTLEKELPKNLLLYKRSSQEKSLNLI